MTRPRTISDEAILDAVLTLVQRVGPTGLTLAAVAAEVGLSPATLVQRFGTKRDLMLAADRRAVEAWVGSLDRATEGSALDRIVDGLVLAVDPDMTSEQMAHSVALLQLDLADTDFHASTLAGARAVRAGIRDRLAEALSLGELRERTDVEALAVLVEMTYHGSMIGWAIHREGDLATWLRAQLEAVLAPHRGVTVRCDAPEPAPGPS